MITTVNAEEPYQDNCWLWLQERLGTVPADEHIFPIYQAPKAGYIAVMEYEKDTYECPLGELVGNKCRIKHFGVVEGVFDDNTFLLSECNMHKLYPSGCGYRILSTDYPNLLGFDDI